MTIQDPNKIKLIKETGLNKYYQANSWAEYNKQIFDTLAPKYDAGNALHSFGTKWKFDRLAMDNINIPKNAIILDLCTGSGDIAIHLAKKYPDANIVALDASEEMMNIAKAKAQGIKNIKFIKGDALNLPFEENHFDAAIISYGLRNLTDINAGIKEMVRVVKPGGFVSSIDQGKPSNFFLRTIYKIYFYNIAPIIGKIVFHLGEYNTFRYLPESNKYYPHPNELLKRFRKFGLGDVKNYNFLFGAIAQQVGKKK